MISAWVGVDMDVHTDILPQTCQNFFMHVDPTGRSRYQRFFQPLVSCPLKDPAYSSTFLRSGMALLARVLLLAPAAEPVARILESKPVPRKLHAFYMLLTWKWTCGFRHLTNSNNESMVRSVASRNESWMTPKGSKKKQFDPGTVKTQIPGEKSHYFQVM